jgi:hypothetical protein
MPRFRRAFVVPLAVLLALAPATLARAEGSVPSEVAAYVADGSLRAQLNDVYGPGPSGEGVDFDDTTTFGTIERVHVWSDALRAGDETEQPVVLINEWIVPVSIAEAPVGLATVWINPATVRAELASYVDDADLATALSAVPDGASLVHDVESSAWLALAADGLLTPLVPGSTGLSTPVPVDDIALLPAGEAATPGGDPGTGVGFAIAVLLLLIAVIVVALLLPGLRRRPAAEASEAADAVDPDARPEALDEPEAAPPAPAESAPKKRPTPKKAAAEPPPAAED